MKKLIVLVLCISCLLSVTACGKKAAVKSPETDSSNETTATQTEPAIEYTTVDSPALKVNKIVNADEMAQYNKIFFEKDEAFDNTDMTKTGIFTILYDAFNGVDRYYVWGYDSEEAVSGWQWEFSVAEGTVLPAVGSEVTVTGKFVQNETALDKRWIENAAVTVVSEYKDSPCKYDLTTMSPILSARVQFPNIISNLDKFNDKVCLYAKVAEGNMLVSPYEGLEWSAHTVSGTVLPAVDTYVTVVGTLDAHGQFLTETLYIE